MKRSSGLTSCGFTLVGVLIALVIVTVCGLTLLQLFSSQRILLGSLDKKEKAVEIANSTIGNMNREDYNSLVALCMNKNVFDVAQPISGTCSNWEKSNASPTGSSDLSVNPYQLEVLRDWSGNNDAHGEVCLELSQCRPQADNHLLDITLNVFFRASNQRISSRTITFRRTRW